MRGPEEAMNAEAQSSSSWEGGSEGNEGRDPCSSPPCKRLKQAVLNFQSNTSTSNSSPPSSSLPSKPSNGVPKQVIVIDDENRAPNCGGLVTAAPSPPEKGHLKPQSSAKDQKDVEKQPNISNFTVPVDKLNDSPKSNDEEIVCSPQQTSSNNAKTPLRPTSAEKKKLKEEKQKLKEEKERQRQEAKVQKEKEKLEAKQKKEQERLEKQAEKEKKEKERLEKKQRDEKEKQEKKEKKEEERRKKEEEINAKLEEKRKKEEEKKQQEEELKRKKIQASLSFKSFFTKTTNAPPKTLPKAVLKFEPFEIKPYMSLAPVLRTQTSKESHQKLDKLMQEQNNVTLYMEELEKRKPLPPYKKERRRTIATKSSSQEEPTEKSDKKEQIEISDDDTSDSESVVEIQQEEKKRMKVIFLKFHENNRPPYYGTQQKRSMKISPRNPLNKDEGLLNYEIDSDDEWEEEEPGESLSDDSDGEDDEPDEGEEEDDGFMVPHGYLSDDEGIDGDDEENEVDSTSKQEQQLAKVKAWEAELKRKCKAKKPVCIGCVWPDNKNIIEMLQQFEACILVDEPAIAIQTTSSATSADSCFQPMSENMTATPDSVYKGGMYVPEEAMPDLITLIHRSSAGVVKLIDLFKQHWSKKCENTKAHPMLAGKGHISKRQLEAKIKAIATKERRNDKPRWYVHDNILAAYGLTKLATTDNGQGMPNIKSCSPQMLNTGIKVFTKSASPSISQGQNGVMEMMTLPQLQTSSNGMQDKQATVQSVSSTQVLQTQKVQSLVAPTANRRVVLQLVSTPEVGAISAKENLPNSQATSAGQSLQAWNDKQSSEAAVAKRRVVLQPASKTEVKGAIAKPSLQATSAGQSLQAWNDKQSSEAAVAKRRVVLQPASRTEVKGAIAKPSLQSTSAGQSLQPQNDKQSSEAAIAKRRVVLQPASKTEVKGAIAKPSLQSTSAGQSLQVQDGKQSTIITPVATQRVLQPVSKPGAGCVSAKENQATQQGVPSEQTIQNDMLLSVTPIAKRRVVLQPVSNSDAAKENQPNPSPSGLKQSCINVEVSDSCTAPSIITTLTKNPEQDTTNIHPSSGLMKSSLANTMTITNSSSTPCTDDVKLTNDAGCVSSAVKRTAPSPVGADRAAKVPRKSEAAAATRTDVNKPAPTETTETVVDTANRPLAQPLLDNPQHQKESQESMRNPNNDTAKLENPNKEIIECKLMKNNLCKTDGIQPMEIEQIIKA